VSAFVAKWAWKGIDSQFTVEMVTSIFVAFILSESAGVSLWNGTAWISWGDGGRLGRRIWAYLFPILLHNRVMFR